MNITRRDTIIIATLCNILVLVCVIATGKIGKASPQNDWNVDMKAVQPLSQNTSDRDMSLKNKPIALAASETKKDDLSSLFQGEVTLSDIHHDDTADMYAFDEIDQLLEEYVSVLPLSQNGSVENFQALQSSKNGNETKASSNAVKNQSGAKSSSNSRESAATNQQSKQKSKESSGVQESKVISDASTSKAAPIKRSSDVELPQKNRSSSTSSSSKDSLANTKATLRKTYTVQPGDNPWTIAKKCRISVDKLLILNNLDEVKAKNLKIGQVLLIEAPLDKDEDDLNSSQSKGDRFKSFSTSSIR